MTRDAIDRPWPAVRRCSQYIWDAVESGALGWDDKEAIQEERVRICLTGNNVASNHNSVQHGSKRSQNVSQKIVCRAYNSRSGCPSRDSHNEGSVFALHICGYCDSVGHTCSHPIRDCE